MSIKKVINPVNDEPMYIAEGVVDKITYREKATQFGHTHQAGIAIDGEWINIALTVKEGYQPQVRFAKGQPGKQTWHNLDEGDTVKIIVKANEYNGKTYYSTTSSKINVVKKGEGGGSQKPSQSPQNGSGSTYQKRDNSGQSIGHSINVAMNVLKSVEDSDAIIANAKLAHDLTSKLKKEYAAKNPSMSEYDVGAMCGQSVLSASHFVDSVEDIEVIARNTLDAIVPTVSAYVRGEKVEEKPSSKVAAKPAAKKTTAAKKVVEAEESIDDEDIPDSAFDEDADSLPF